MAANPPMFVRVMGLPLRLALYLLACLLLMVVDARLNTLQLARAGLAALLHPVQAGLSRPFFALREAMDFFQVHGRLVQEKQRLVLERQALVRQLQDRELLVAENAHLRRLLGLEVPPGYAGQGVEVLQALTNPFARKVLVDRGSLQGIRPGWPVVDHLGLVGQVTRVYPHASEVTLITSNEQDVPVLVLRNGLRLVVSGLGQDRLLEVRFLDMHADLRPGDVLVTSGLDGIYPAGIPVARVIATEPPRGSPFARAVCTPLAGVGRNRQLLVLQRQEAPQPTAVAPTGRQPARRSPGPSP